MVEDTRALFEAPIFGLFVCLVTLLPRDLAGEGAIATPPANEGGGASVGQGGPPPPPPPPPPGAPPPAVLGFSRGAGSFAAAAARALMTLLPFLESLLHKSGVEERDVPDVAQDVVLQVLPWWMGCRAVDPALPPEAARGYLRMTAIRTAIRHRRRRVRRGECLGWEDTWADRGADPGPSSPGVVCSPEDEWLQREAAAELAREADLARLSTATDPARWRAFHAHVVDGVPVTEIAEAERSPVVTIYRRISLARSDLRAALLRSRAAKRPG